ncbi:hypothetical protein SS1G_11575 [Sclerotinia sclerotiorum 1980 UF-70]|uniref:Clr5 domain-containing protein n=2 Tax=Sclerotinia sclerotiorum (strain ATCC 18683 / 1980 / Ss-1) TaxID=665079 RepID=A7F1V4_SCLS1|nr:hypothetical protein SS1G_11575 [Sclerotinia sclerotiorum 1980 UF-70]APA11329.1 hypothetical protein sscle_07g060990 [Sclerotinia sclerotiorum 1980 UF-70]EDN95696.1 hypothetical protein SS1G_11575 [Sclerotinia sclerotiorum 1980 UF-70]
MNADEFQDPLFGFPSFFDDNLTSQQEFIPTYRGELNLVDNFSRDVRRTISAPDNLRTPLPPVSQSSLLLPGIDQTMNHSTANHTSPIAAPSNVAHQMPPIVDSMPSLPKPARRPALTEHSAEDWERQRATFTRLYTAEDKTLKEVMEIMENEHGFRATPRQYKRRIEQWKLDKNIKESDMRIILRKDLKRKHEGKKSEFKISGRDVEPQKIERFAQRKKMTEESILGFDIETPGYIACDTPAPTMVDEGMMHHTGGDIDMEDSTATPLQTVDSRKKRQIPLGFTTETLSSFIKRVDNGSPIDIDFDAEFFASALFKSRSTKSNICRRCSRFLNHLLCRDSKEVSWYKFLPNYPHDNLSYDILLPSLSKGQIPRTISLLIQFHVTIVIRGKNARSNGILTFAVENASYVSFAFFNRDSPGGSEADSIELTSAPDVPWIVGYLDICDRPKFIVDYEHNEYLELWNIFPRHVVDYRYEYEFIQHVKDQLQDLLDSNNSASQADMEDI